MTITSQEEQDFIYNMIREGKKKTYWLGGRTGSGSGRWITGEAFKYSNWAPGQPDAYRNAESYMQIYNDYNPRSSNGIGDWNDITVDNVIPGEEDFFLKKYSGYICEWDKTRGTADFSRARLLFNKFKISSAEKTYSLDFLPIQGGWTGVCGDMVPQGVCVTDKYILVTAYCKQKKHSSILCVISKGSGRTVKILKLGDKLNSKGERSININHVGGLVVDDHKTLWIANSTKSAVEAIPMSEVLSAPNGSKLSEGTIFTCPVNKKGSRKIQSVSFVTYYDGKLYAGFYAQAGDTASEGKDVSSCLYGYTVKRKGDTPVSISYKEKISIPKKTDGACFVKSGGKTYLITNQHGGRKDKSTVTIYQMKSGTAKKKKKSFSMPCLLENAATDGTYIYNVYESGAAHFAADPATKYVIPFVTKGIIRAYIR